MFTLLKLSYFLEAAKASSFSEAAMRLYTTQPNVSKQVALLEKDLGVDLFSRKNGQVALTKAGRYLFDKLKDIPDMLEGTCREAATIGRMTQRTLNVGVFQRTQGYKTHLAILEFAKKHPEFTFNVEREDYHALCEGMLRSIYDLIITDEVELPVFSGKFEKRKVYDRPLSVLISSDSHLRDRASISLEELRDEPFIVRIPRDKGTCSDQFSSLFRMAGYQPSIVREVFSLESLFLYVSLDEGITIVDENGGVMNSPGLKLLPLVPAISLPVFALWSPEIDQDLAYALTDFLIEARI